MIDIRHFKHMVVLAKEMHFTSAAKHLNIAQPALSQSIRQLEQETGVRLFNRNSRNVSLTPAGKAFYEEAIKTLQQLEGTIQIAQRVARGEHGTLSIGFSTSAMSAYLPTLLRSFREKHGKVGLQFEEFLTDDLLIDALRQGRFDLGCTVRCLRVDTLESLLLKVVPIVVALNKNHRLAHAPSVHLKDLADDTFIVPTRTRYNYLPAGSIPRIWRQAGFSPRIGFRVESISAVLGLVAADVGVSMIHHPLMIESPDVVMVPIADVAASLPMQILWRKDSYSLEVRSFIESAQETKLGTRHLQRKLSRASPLPKTK